MKDSFSSGEVVGLFGLTHRMLLYWDVTGLVRPSRPRKGRYRRYNMNDLFLLGLIARASTQSRKNKIRFASIQQIRSSIPGIRSFLEGGPEGVLENTTVLLERKRLKYGRLTCRAVLAFSPICTVGWEAGEYLVYTGKELIARVISRFPEKPSASASHKNKVAQVA